MHEPSVFVTLWFDAVFDIVERIKEGRTLEQKRFIAEFSRTEIRDIFGADWITKRLPGRLQDITLYAFYIIYEVRKKKKRISRAN